MEKMKNEIKMILSKNEREFFLLHSSKVVAEFLKRT